MSFKSIVAENINRLIFPLNSKLVPINTKRNRYLSRIDDHLYSELYGENIKSRKILLNFGAGPFKHSNWTNVDYFSETMR